ncbi:MAG: RING finger protein [Planctomycetota bacterium]
MPELRQRTPERETCPLCREALEEREAIVACERCTTRYHWACVDELGRGGCMTLACPGALLPVHVPPPPEPDLGQQMLDRVKARFVARGRRGDAPEAAPPAGVTPEAEPPAGETTADAARVELPPPAPEAPGLTISVLGRREPTTPVSLRPPSPYGQPQGTPLSEAQAQDQYESRLRRWRPRRATPGAPDADAPFWPWVAMGCSALLFFALLVLGPLPPAVFSLLLALAGGLLALGAHSLGA